MTVLEKIRETLTAALSPELLEIVDESHLHAGHSGARPGGESHFRVNIVSAAFEGHNRVSRQRQVYKALEVEMAGPIHALALTTKTPGEVSEVN